MSFPDLSVLIRFTERDNQLRRTSVVIPEGKNFQEIRDRVGEICFHSGLGYSISPYHPNFFSRCCFGEEEKLFITITKPGWKEYVIKNLYNRFKKELPEKFGPSGSISINPVEFGGLQKEPGGIEAVLNPDLRRILGRETGWELQERESPESWDWKIEKIGQREKSDHEKIP